MSNSLSAHGLQHTRPPCPLPSPRVCPNSCPLNRWCHPTISSSVTLFSCFKSFQTSGSFPMSQFLASGGQSIGASASVLPMSIQDWFPLRLTGLISLLSKGLSESSPTPQFKSSHEIKRCLLLGRKCYEKPRQCIKQQRHHFADKGPYSQSYGFSSSHVWMW